MLGLLLVAAAVGLSNFAASIGIGLSGVNAGVRVRVAIIFGIFEAAMPIVGLLIGHRLAASFGSAASYIGGGLLIAIGIYSVVQARLHRSREVPVPTGTGRLMASGAALSIDNLVVGFALGTYKVSVVLAAVVIAVVSVGMSLIGLELGHRPGGCGGEPERRDRWRGAGGRGSRHRRRGSQLTRDLLVRAGAARR